MKKYLFAISTLTIFYLNAQNGSVGINTESPKATLHVLGNPSDTSKLDGIIAPIITGDELAAKTYGTDQTGAVIYVTAPCSNLSGQVINVSKIGYYYFNGSEWIPLNSEEKDTLESVMLRGNYAPKKIDFETTSNPFSLYYKNNNFFASNSFNNLSTGTHNILLGQKTGENLSTATKNILIGNSSGNYLTSGSQNVFIGYNSGFSYNTGKNNSINGNASGQGSLSLNFPVGGIYMISVTPLNELGFKAEVNNQLDANKLIDVIQWGDIKWEANLSEMFKNCKNITTFSAFDIPDFSNVTNMSAMFRGAENFNSDISDWDTSNVTNMYAMFAYNKKFNQPIENWNLSKVTTTNAMFYNAISFNQPIGNWNTANVTNMSAMFRGATSFNQPIENWNTANVTNMSSMFSDATSFNQPIENWNTANVTDMNGILQNATAFNQSLGKWNLSKITSGAFGFRYGISGTSINCINYTKTLKGWAENNNTSKGISLQTTGLKYGTEGEIYRNILVNNKNWNISEDVFDSTCNYSLNIENSNLKDSFKI